MQTGLEHADAPPLKRAAPVPDPKSPSLKLLEPQADWLVDAFHYWADPGGDWSTVPASIYLASDESGQPKGAQFWSWGDPTVYHGGWQCGRGTLQVRFNCRGPVDEAREPRPLKTTYVHLNPDNSWVGEDSHRRQVRMVQYGSWVVRSRGGCLVWEEYAALQHRLGQ